MDLTALSAGDLDQLREDVASEQERRRNLARIPDTITDLSRAYTESGGDPADLVQALTPDQAAALGK